MEHARISAQLARAQATEVEKHEVWTLRIVLGRVIKMRRSAVARAWVRWGEVVLGARARLGALMLVARRWTRQVRVCLFLWLGLGLWLWLGYGAGGGWVVGCVCE